MRGWNPVLTRFFAFEKKYPNDNELGFVKIKFLLPSNLLDERACDSSGAQGVIDLYGSNEATDRLMEFVGRIESFTHNIANAENFRRYEETQKALEAAEAQVATANLAEIKNKKPPARKTSIACIKGKVIKKVTGTNPVCPSGYKKK